MAGISIVIVLGVQNPQIKSVLVPFEIVCSTIPFIGIMMAMCKLIWRIHMYAESGSSSNMNSWGMEGCLP
jgi:hypothetical protein